MAIFPWLRKIVVTLGPLEEYKGASGGSTVQFVSDGTQNGLRAACNINKTVMGMPNPSTISIYNLSQDTRRSIHKSLTKVTVEAGWLNTEMHKVFQGSVMSVVSERQGTEIVTKLSCLPGYGALVVSSVSVSYKQGVAVREAVKDLGAKLPGVGVDDNNLKDIDGVFDQSGWSFAGGAKDALTELAGEHGFSWTIDDGSLMAVGDKSKFDGLVALDGKQGGLILVSPTLQGPLQVRTGVKIKAIYVPGVKPGATVRVRSSIDESLDGDYRIHTANFNLDAYSEEFTMDLESFKFGSGAAIGELPAGGSLFNGR